MPDQSAIKNSTIKKIGKIIFYILVVLIVTCFALFIIGRPQKDITWGITFSTSRAQELDFKPQELFSTIVTDLKPQIIRLPVYWAELEPQQGQFNFEPIDTLLTIADQNNVDIVLGLGKKQPRWPECHQPEWYNQLTTAEQDQAVLTMLETAVVHFKTHPSIKSWQIENEPYFDFGLNCPVVESELYKKEIATVKQLDNRPTIATDSGEKGAWVFAGWSGADILGVTMYREVYHGEKEKYITYPLPWWTYNVKAGLVKLLTGADLIIGAELQAEPWLKISSPKDSTPVQQFEHMNPQIFKANVDYARKAGFSENYLWGAEWWYWLQKTHNDSSMVNAAKDLFNN